MPTAIKGETNRNTNGQTTRIIADRNEPSLATELAKTVAEKTGKKIIKSAEINCFPVIGAVKILALPARDSITINNMPAAIRKPPKGSQINSEPSKESDKKATQSAAQKSV